MTADDFDRLAARTRLRDPALAAARMVRVDGLTRAEAARRVGRTRATVSAAVARIDGELRRASGTPVGWEVVTVVVPPATAQDIRTIETRERKRAGR